MLLCPLGFHGFRKKNQLGIRKKDFFANRRAYKKSPPLKQKLKKNIFKLEGN